MNAQGGIVANPSRAAPLIHESHPDGQVWLLIRNAGHRGLGRITLYLFL